MFEFITHTAQFVLPFLAVLTILVFVHEFGHYIVARFCGVKVEMFSIGFGPELFGFNDKHGTRWKFSLIPLGGYVQMFGDADPTSATQDDAKIAQMSTAQRKVAFYSKSVAQRSAIVAAGPLINFVYAIVVIMAVFLTIGENYAPAKVGDLVPKGAAEQAGFKKGDIILQANGESLASFQDLQRIVSVNLGANIAFDIQRGTEKLHIVAAPKKVTLKDNFGFIHAIGRLGIMSEGNTAMREHNAVSAIKAATLETYAMAASTLKAMGQMVTGVRSTDELGGVLRIGAYAQKYSQAGWVSLLMFSAIISVNLGLINLFPIPLLDGGHLMFYAGEAILRRPVSVKIRNAGARVGYVLVLALMVYATFNDLLQLKVFHNIARLFS